MSVDSVSSAPVATRAPANVQESNKRMSTTQKVIDLITRSIESIWRGAKQGACEAVELFGHYFAVGVSLATGFLFVAWASRDIIRDIFRQVTAR